MTNATLGITNNMASREKYWSEITHEEKTERTRNQIKMLQNRIDDLENALQIIRKTFLNHSHSDNNIVQKVNEFESHYGNTPHGRIGRLNANMDEIYF